MSLLNPLLPIPIKVTKCNEVRVSKSGMVWVCCLLAHDQSPNQHYLVREL